MNEISTQLSALGNDLEPRPEQRDPVHTSYFTRDAETIAIETELAAQNHRVKATYESADIGIAETDAKGRFIRVNDAMCSMTGYGRQELLQQTFLDQLHPTEREAKRLSYARLVKGELTSYEIDTRFIHKSGHTVWLTGTCTAVRDEQGHFLFGVRILRDETVRKTLYQFTENLNASTNVGTVYEHALAAITGALRCNRASILLFDDAKVMKFVASKGLSATYRSAVEGHSPWTPETKEPTPVIVCDVEMSDFPRELKRAIHEEGIHALAFFPLTVDGKVIGKFMAYFDEPHKFNDEDEWSALTIARQLSLAIARHSAMRTLREVNARISADVEALRRLHIASSRLWRCSTLVEGLEAILDGAIEATGASMGNVQVLDPERKVLRIATQRGFKQPFLDFFAEVSAGDQSVCGRALSSGERIIVSDVDIDPGFAPMRHIAREAGFRSVQSTPLIGRSGRAFGMLSTHFTESRIPTEQELRRLDLYARQAGDFIDRCNMERALQDSEARERARALELESIMASVPAAIWLSKNTSCDAITGNAAAERLLGIAPGSNHWHSDPEGELSKHVEVYSKGRKLPASDLPIHRAARGENIRDFEMELRFSDGTARTLLGNAVPLRGADGQPSGSVAAFIDITERRRAERQRSLLVAELSHRVKNTLATVFALWHHTCAKAENLDAAKKSFEARLLALSQTHTRLSEGDWDGTSLKTMINDELRPYLNDDAKNLVVDGPDLILNSRAALTLGLAFHELTTNAAKHGALSRSGGRVLISWTTIGDTVSIEWREEGGPAVSAPVRRGFGRFLIERGVSSDFKGNVDLIFDPLGVICRITAPLLNVAVREGDRS